jgi:hypothetical protein
VQLLLRAVCCSLLQNVTLNVNYEFFLSYFEALHFCGEDQLLGVAWILVRNWDNPLLERIVKNDLMIRLTDLPFWIDESGSFEGNPTKNCSFDYWSEDNQLNWLTSGYLVGKPYKNQPILYFDL